MTPRPLLKFARWAILVLVGGGLVGGLAKLFYSVVVVLGVATELRACAVWGALLLASFTGWGGALNTFVHARARADWGLRCTWGWGVVVAIGGILCALGWARGFILVRVVAIGLFLLATDVIYDLARWARRGVSRRSILTWADRRFYFGAAVVFLFGVVQAGAGIQNSEFNSNDDLLAYFQFAREIVERGTLTQPFSLRHMSAYGGKSFLDALAISIDIRETHLHIVDKGLAFLTVLGLVAGHARASRRASRPIVLLTMGFLVALPAVGINTTSMMTGVLFFLGIYRTLSWPPIVPKYAGATGLPVALLAAGACTLRQNYLPAVAVLLVVAYGRPIVASLRLRPFTFSREAVLDAALTAGLLVGCLAPWWGLTYRWCGSFLFPAFNGNYNRDYAFFFKMSGLEWAQYIWSNVAYCLPIKALPLFALAAALSPKRGPRAPGRAMVLAAIGGFGSLVYGYSNGTPPDQGRYYFGFSAAAVLAIALGAADLATKRVAPGRASANRALAVGLVVVAMALQMYEERGAIASMYQRYLELIGTNRIPWAPSVRDSGYAKLQGSVPASAPIAVMVDAPARFDQARNRIACLDMVGAVAPRPGIPLAAGGEAVARYFLDQGYRYLIFVNPALAKSLYRRDVWQKQEKKSAKVWELSAHFYLEAFDDFEELSASRLHLAEADGMTLLDLAEPRK